MVFSRESDPCSTRPLSRTFRISGNASPIPIASCIPTRLRGIAETRIRFHLGIAHTQNSKSAWTVAKVQYPCQPIRTGFLPMGGHPAMFGEVKIHRWFADGRKRVRRFTQRPSKIVERQRRVASCHSNQFLQWPNRWPGTGALMRESREMANRQDTCDVISSRGHAGIGPFYSRCQVKRRYGHLTISMLS